jgi:hypothetical protein
MNQVTIERIIMQSESSLYEHKSGNKSGKKERDTAEYWKIKGRERRKGEKTRIQQKRRKYARLENLPTEKDIELENIHFANFRGDKHGTFPYNDPAEQGSIVSLSDCDICLRPDQVSPYENDPECPKQEEQIQEEEHIFISELGRDFCDFSIPEEDRKYYMQLMYIQETRTLTGATIFCHKDEQVNEDEIWVIEMM